MSITTFNTSSGSNLDKPCSQSNFDSHKYERVEFVHSMDKILKKVAAHSVNSVDKSVSNHLQNWINRVLENNVGSGKLLRGMMVVMTYKSFVKDPTPSEMEKAHAIGWAVEIIQAASLIADDIMDHSETRRGKPCWYKKPEVGMSAVNDAFMVEMVALNILKVYFDKDPCYRELYNVMAHVLYLTVFGQGLDCLTEKTENILESYTMERYNAIVKYKTSYYTVYLPVVLGIILAGKGNDFKIMQIVEKITLKIGHFFQVQDDYLDCFGDPKKTGKVGTDIQDNKCSWLFVKAVDKCSPKQLELLLENYGKRNIECVDKVKKLYCDLELKQEYLDYEDETLEYIKEMVTDIEEDNAEGNGFLSPNLFLELLDKLYKRAE